MYPYVEGKTLRQYFTGEAKQSPSLHERLWQQLNERMAATRGTACQPGRYERPQLHHLPAGQLWLIDLDKSRFYSHPNTAAAHQDRAWKKLLRSAAKC